MASTSRLTAIEKIPHGHQVASGVGKALAEHITKFIVAGTLLQRRRATSASASTTPAAGGAATVLVASTMVARGRRRRLFDHNGGSRRGLCFSRMDGSTDGGSAILAFEGDCFSPVNATRGSSARAEGGSNHGRSGTILAVRGAARQAALRANFQRSKRSLRPTTSVNPAISQ